LVLILLFKQTVAVLIYYFLRTLGYDCGLNWRWIFFVSLDYLPTIIWILKVGLIQEFSIDFIEINGVQSEMYSCVDGYNLVDALLWIHDDPQLTFWL
jgi:hypothetical protein